MLDSRINQNFNRPIANPQFRASQNVTKPFEVEEKQGMSTTAKWAIGLGLTALASYGIYYALTKGRVKAPKPTPKPENPIPEIKEMAIDAFKRDNDAKKEGVNRLVNGRAILADGTKYTGNITSAGEDGSKIVMEYVDGVLQKSTKTAKDGTKVFEKTYTYSKSCGKLDIVKKDGEKIFIRSVDGARLSDGYYRYNIDKSLITVEKDNGTIKGYESINGKRILRAEALPEDPRTLIFYRNDGSREFALKNCHISGNSGGSGTKWNDIIEVYDNKGTLIKTLEQYKDPKDYYLYRAKYVDWFEKMNK